MRRRPANLLIVTSGLGIGGAETVIRDLVHGIDRGRFNVAVCCLQVLGEIGEQLARDGIDIAVLPRPEGSGVDYLTFLKLRRVVQAKRADIVHSHTTHALVDACLSKITMPRLKVVHTFHFGNYPHVVHREWWMERVFSRVADRLIAVGEAQRRQIKATYSLPDRRIGTVRNGVGPVHDRGGLEYRARLGCANGVLVGTLANLIDQKGLPDLLTVASKFRHRAGQVRFVVFGEGALRPDLEAMRHRLGLEQVVLLPGWVRDAAATALPAVDVYFQPSLWEAMSIAILEAMAAGKPVVATRVGEAPYMIDDGQDGFLANPGDVDGMAAALARLVDDPPLRERVGAAAAAKVAVRFGVDRMIRTYEQIYLELLDREGGR